MSQMQQIPRDYIVIEGNIGSGKTTLAKILSELWGTRLILENFADNPFLPKFYENPEKHAFALELSFLAERYHQNRNELSRTDLFHPGVVADYSFAKSLIFAKINLPEDEFELYQSLFQIINGRLPKPDLLIYLHCTEEKSLRQIVSRGRAYETVIELEYLQKITSGYLDYFKQQLELTILIIETNNIDFVANEQDLTTLIQQINRPYLTGIHRIAMS